ncbi:MAG: cell division protein ZapA [Cellulosilyticum sp.]|nr:cell division protein ZapA [Cellulosilyticum sp.]
MRIVHVMGCEYMSKNRVEVVIGGNIISLQGNESEEHMQRVAKVINEKLAEIQGNYEKMHIGQSKINTLLVLNLADECVKRQQALGSHTTSLQEIKLENEKLKETVKELTLQLAHTREQLAAATHQGKKEHGNRGR